MNKTTNWMVHDHQKYDALLTECEMAAEMADWKDALRLFNEFTTDLKIHMQLEDDILYPLFDSKEIDSENEMEILHDEHENIVRLLRDLACIIKTKNIDHFMESLLPLHKVMNEHNEHEEKVFQKLGSDALLSQHDEIMERLANLQKEKGHKPREWGF